MLDIRNYRGREQSYVKHVFLESYLERLAFKTARAYGHVVYVDGFAGPWQSANEAFEDTSFGIALKILRRVKSEWESRGYRVEVSAHLVERDPSAYDRLSGVPNKYGDIKVNVYPGDFLDRIDEIVSKIPPSAFTFFFLDPKGWRIPLHRIAPVLKRPKSELVFNFMFDFINRAASMTDPSIVSGLEELIPFGDWRRRMQDLEGSGQADPVARKEVLVSSFCESLKKLGDFEYVAETTVLRPLMDRPLYCLFYASRHPNGIEVFRDAQITSLKQEAKVRAAVKVAQAAAATGQGELFSSLHDMAPNELEAFLSNERARAEKTILELAPVPPEFIKYEVLRAQTMARHVVRAADVNEIAGALYRAQRLSFPDWEKRRRVPQPGYRTQRGERP